MDTATRSWLLSQLGRSTDIVDLDARYTRLASARAVALEILHERRAVLIFDQPATIGVSGVINAGYAENIKAIERTIAILESGQPLAPDETAPEPDVDDTPDGVGFIQLVPRRRR